MLPLLHWCEIMFHVRIVSEDLLHIMSYILALMLRWLLRVKTCKTGHKMKLLLALQKLFKICNPNFNSFRFFHEQMNFFCWIKLI
jgi:hypothetical protein